MNIFIIMKTGSLFSIPEPLPISRIHHFPLLSLCHKKIKRHESVAKNYTPKLCTFMDAFDLMTSLSATFPTYILRALSADYIKSSFLFYTQHSREIPFNELWDRMLRIRKNNYIHLPLSLKIKYALYGIRLILRAWLK